MLLPPRSPHTACRAAVSERVAIIRTVPSLQTARGLVGEAQAAKGACGHRGPPPLAAARTAAIMDGGAGEPGYVVWAAAADGSACTWALGSLALLGSFVFGRVLCSV